MQPGWVEFLSRPEFSAVWYMRYLIFLEELYMVHVAPRVYNGICNYAPYSIPYYMCFRNIMNYAIEEMKNVERLVTCIGTFM